MAGRRFTQEEVDYLFKNVGNVTLSTMAKKLDRTVNSVSQKMTRLGIGDTILESGKMTVLGLAKILKTDSHVIMRWISNHGLKSVRRPTSDKAIYNLISVKDFWKWAEQNKDKVNFYKIEPLTLLPEPDWVDAERKKDYHTIPSRRAARWTEEEDERLIEMLKGGYKQREIGEALGRGQGAVDRRLSRLREKRKIPFVKVILRWSDEELNMMLELERQGLSDDVIAYELGREANHIRDKRRLLARKGLHPGKKKVEVG